MQRCWFETLQFLKRLTHSPRPTALWHFLITARNARQVLQTSQDSAAPTCYVPSRPHPTQVRPAHTSVGALWGLTKGGKRCSERTLRCENIYFKTTIIQPISLTTLSKVILDRIKMGNYRLWFLPPSPVEILTNHLKPSTPPSSQRNKHQLPLAKSGH